MNFTSVNKIVLRNMELTFTDPELNNVDSERLEGAAIQFLLTYQEVALNWEFPQFRVIVDPPQVKAVLPDRILLVGKIKGMNWELWVMRR